MIFLKEDLYNTKIKNIEAEVEYPFNFILSGKILCQVHTVMEKAVSHLLMLQNYNNSKQKNS